MECLLDIFNPPETKSPTLYLNVANENMKLEITNFIKQKLAKKS